MQEELGILTELQFISKDLYSAKDRPDKIIFSYKALYDGSLMKLEDGKVASVDFFTMDKIKKIIESG